VDVVLDVIPITTIHPRKEQVAVRS